MDEAEEYQQMLQAMAERRRQQEDDKRLRRETKEEWLKTAQEKRRFLREQWLSDATPAPSPDVSTPVPPSEEEADEPTAAESQKTPEVDEAADASEEEKAFQIEKGESGSNTSRTHNNHKAGSDEKAQVNKESEDHIFSVQMAERTLHDRSVLGTVAVQVERDPRTGATVVRSVAPASSPAGAPMAFTVFDDGRRCIHTVGGVEGQPSTEELGQILSVIDGFGMKVLLDEVTVAPNKAGEKMKDAEAATVSGGEVTLFSTHPTITEDDSEPLEAFQRSELEGQLGKADIAAIMEDKENKKEDESILVVPHFTGEVHKLQGQSLEESPVTLLFLGYADSTHGEDEEDYEGMLTAERVIITDEGEVLEPASPLVEEESQEKGFQEVPLEENGATGVQNQAEDGDKVQQKSPLPNKAEGGGPSKRKTCQCCSVM